MKGHYFDNNDQQLKFVSLGFVSFSFFVAYPDLGSGGNNSGMDMEKQFLFMAISINFSRETPRRSQDSQEI